MIMKKITFFVLIALLIGISTNVNSQGVAINTDGSDPDGSAMLDVTSTSSGILIPRMSSTERGNIVLPAKGLMVYDITLNQVYMNTGTSGNPTWTNISTGQLWTRVGSYTYLTNSSDDVGIGTSTPARALEVRGHWRTARLSSTSYGGAFLEFVGTDATDWAIGTWNGTARISSSTDEFANSSTEFLFSTTYLGPFSNDDKDLGRSSDRWKNLYSIDGDFSGDVGIGTSSPARLLEISGSYPSVRLSTTGGGTWIEYNGSDSPDWGIGTWGASVRFFSSSDNFSSTSDEYFFSTTTFRPWANNDKYLGSSSYRWKNIYSIDGNFSDDIYLSDNVKFSTLSGMLHIYDYINSNATVYITPQTSTTGDSASIFLAEDHDATYGMYWLYDGDDNEMELWGKSLSSHYGPHIVVERASGDVGIGVTSPASKLDVKGNITVRNSSGTIVLELGSGLDYAEGFDVSEKSVVEPGTILSIDPQNPGKLKVCDQAYDKKVAGIVAGAKGLGSGVRLGVDEYDYDVALAGRVYCNVDATAMAVEPGDLLTTSFTPGYAMKAEDNQKVHGSILGKAMESLEKGKKGQILVLVTLQ